MLLNPALRKLALTVHVVVSVGWIGTIAGFFVLAVAGLASADMQLAQAAYRTMNLVTWVLIVPLGFAALLSGIVSSIGTSWGLFRYWWVVVKLIVTVLSTLILMVHTSVIGMLSQAGEAALSPGLFGQRLQMALASGAAIAALILLTVLSLYKPPGLTAYGLRKLATRRT